MTEIVSRRRLIYRRVFLSTIFLTAIIIGIIIFPIVSDLIVVTIVSFVLMYIFRPGVVLLERREISRLAAVTILFTIATGLLILVSIYFFPVIIREFLTLVSDIQEFDIAGTYKTAVDWINGWIPDAGERLKINPDWAATWASEISTTVGTFLKKSVVLVAGAFNLIVLATVVPFLTFFLLKDGPDISKKFIERVPNRFFEMTLSLMHRIDDKLGSYIRSILFESLIIWLMTWPALALLGIKFSLVLGLVHGILNMIPYFGPLVAYIPVSIIVLISYPSPGWGLFWMVVVMLSIQIIDNILLKPLIVSKSVRLHPAIVLVGVLVGGKLAGAVGMFVAVPLFSIIQVVILDLYEHLKNYKII